MVFALKFAGASVKGLLRRPAAAPASYFNFGVTTQHVLSTGIPLLVETAEVVVGVGIVAYMAGTLIPKNSKR